MKLKNVDKKLVSIYGKCDRKIDKARFLYTFSMTIQINQSKTKKKGLNQ